MLALVAVGWYTSLDLDDLRRPRPEGSNAQITLLDRAGVAFANFGDRYGDYLRLDQMSPWLPKAVVAIEDRRFYQHPGIDPIGIARALVEDLKAGHVVEGGSTISQQLAKLAFLSPERSLVRKIKEAFYALWIEARFSKQQILEAYLNRVYLGSGAYGVDAAAQALFRQARGRAVAGRGGDACGRDQGALLLRPDPRSRARAQARGRGAGQHGRGGAREPRAGGGRRKPIPPTLAAPKMRADSGYLADWVAAESRLYADPGEGRLEVRTTFDPKLQQAAEAAVAAVFARTGAKVGQAALVAMTPDGEVRAMLGGRAYAESQFNRATQAERQPGSAFKLFVYLAALEAGLRPEDQISAAPLEVDGWRPRNDDDAYPPALTLTDAFANSVNTAAVRLTEQVGHKAVIKMAGRLGITSTLRDDPSLALGSSEVRLLELTGAYASIANGGRLVWPEAILSVAGADGRLLYQRRVVDEPVLEPAVVRAMRAMLEVTVLRGTGRQAALRRFVAGKTGTSSDNRDAWFIGFTDDLVAGVWVGNDDGQPMAGVSGGSLPAQIFREFILRAEGDEPFLPAAAATQAARPPAGRRRRRLRFRRRPFDQTPVRRRLSLNRPARSGAAAAGG